MGDLSLCQLMRSGLVGRCQHGTLLRLLGTLLPCLHFGGVLHEAELLEFLIRRGTSSGITSAGVRGCPDHAAGGEVKVED
jgi:hypothetical protein